MAAATTAVPELPLHQRTLGNLIARNAALFGQRTCLLFEDRRYSYADAHHLSDRIAAGLAAAGIHQGDHVALLLDNRPEVLWIHFALAKLGAVPVPINTAARGELLSYYLVNSDSVAIIVQAGLGERYRAVEERCRQIRLAVVFDEAARPADTLASAAFAVRTIGFAAVAEGGTPPAAGTARFNDLAHIFYTSGTTGPSKGCMVAHATALGISMKYVGTFGYGPDDVLYTCLPLFHGNAFNCTLLPAFLCGATVALAGRFSARGFWDDIRRHGATQFTLLSAMINIIWNQPSSPRDREHRARICQIIPTPEFFHEFEARFGVKLVSLYSLSDFGLGAMLAPDHPPVKWRSAGLVQPDVAVAILDDDDLPLPNGTVGEICLRNNDPWICRQGYYKLPEAYVAACRNFWFHTGDRGYLDEDGYLYFVDRKKDVIRRRGENISAYELEQIIARHPAVAEVAAFPVRSEMSEDEVMVTVVLRENATMEPEALIRFCNGNMAYFMVPRYVEFAAGLPKTMSQKVEKYKLRQAAEPRLPTLWDRERAGIALER